MKKLTWALLSLMLFLGLGVAFAEGAITVTLNPAPGTVADGTPVTITVAYADGYTANGVANWGLFATKNEADGATYVVLDDYDETHQPVITTGKTWLKVRVVANAAEGGKTETFEQSYEYTLEAGELPTPRIFVNGNPIESYEVTSDATIAIICGEGIGCERWYTTDGSTPAKDGAKSTKYTEAFEIGSLLAEGEEEGEVTIKAITVDGDKTSAVATARFTVAPPAVDLVFSDPQIQSGTGLKDIYGKYVELVPNILMGAYPAAYQMYYTVDGSEPDEDESDMISYNPLGDEDDDPVYIMFTENTTAFKAVGYAMPMTFDDDDMPVVDQSATVQFTINRTMTAVEVDDLALKIEKADGKRVAKIENADYFDVIYYTTDGTVPSYLERKKETYDAEKGITLEADETVKIIGYIVDRRLGATAGSDMIILPAAPTFAEPLEVKQGEGLKINLPEDLDLADYLDGAFILYVENDDKTELTYEGTWNELLAWAQGAPGGPDDEDPGYPGFPDDDFGVGYALTADEEPVAEPAYKVAYYDAEEEMWRPAAFLATVGDAVKVRARLAVGKDANGTLIYSDETNATYKVSANALKTPTFFVNGEELKAATVKVTPGTQVSFESGYEDAEEAGDYEYVICYAFDATDEDFDNASAIALTMGESNIMMYYPDFTKIEVNKSGKLMARVAQMYNDGHIWWSASKEVTFEVDFVIEVSPLLGGDTFGKNVALGVSVNIGETNPIGMPMYADNKYPTAVYYTIDGTTEPSKAAYDAQADKVNGAIKKLENTLEDGFAVMDANGNNISLPLFDKDIHLKAKAYVTKGEETVETVLFDKALKVKAGANPGLNPVSGTVVKVGDTIVIKNPAPLSDGDDEYGGYGGDGDGDLSEAALGTLYFSFDGTLPTIANFGSQEYDEENEADPYHAWNVWQAAEGADVKIMIQEDAQGLYAYVPAIGESIWTPQKDTIRLEGGMLFVQAWCLTAIEAGRDPRTGMSKTFDCGSDFIKGAYTDGSVSLTFDPASGAEVDENTAVAITASQNVEIFYMMFESEEAAKAAAWDQEKALSYSSELKPVLSLEKTTIKAAYALAGADVVMNDFSYATYTVKELPAITLTFNPASGSEVEDNTKVTVTASREVEIFYNLYADKAAADADKETFMANAKEVAEDGMPVITKAAPYLRCAVTDRGEMKYFDATYKIKEVANEGEEELAGVSVYPNPSNGMFNLELPVAATVEVFASNGVLVQRMTLGEGNATLNIERSGIYFLRITGEGRTTVKRLIVR